MVAGELADLAGEADRAIREEDLSLADAAGIEEDLPRCRKARRVFVAEAEIERAERDPAGLTAPPDMDQSLAMGSRLSKRAQVSGAASRSNRAVKANGPALMRRSAIWAAIAARH